MSRHAALACALLVTAGVVTALVIGASRPIEQTFPVYRQLAQDLRTGDAASTFTPLGYPWLVSVIPTASIDTAAKTLHFVCYLVLTAIVYAWLVASRRELPAVLGIAAGAWILFNPYVLVNLSRWNDNSVTVPAMLAVFLLVRYGPELQARGWPVAPVSGALVALAMFVRLNALTILPVVWLAAWWQRRDAPRRAVRPMLASGVAAIVVYASLSLAATGAPMFWAANGPYNVFAGNNPASYTATVTDYNAELSLYRGLAWCGVASTPQATTAGDFLRCTRRFVVEYPAEALRITAYKTYNLLWRPNLRLATSPSQVVIQYGMVVPSVVWFLASAVVMVRSRRVMDPIATVFVAAFVLPFALSNSDPRLRLPLDPIFAISLASAAAAAPMRELAPTRAAIAR